MAASYKRTETFREQGSLLQEAVEDVLVDGLEAVEVGDWGALVDLVDGGVDQAQFEDFAAQGGYVAAV